MALSFRKHPAAEHFVAELCVDGEGDRLDLNKYISRMRSTDVAPASEEREIQRVISPDIRPCDVVECAASSIPDSTSSPHWQPPQAVQRG